MLHRIREAWSTEARALFFGPVEVDETRVGGRRKNMPKTRREVLTGCGGAGKSIVADRTAGGAKVCTDEHGLRQRRPFDHEAVNHGFGEYVRQQAHVNGMESFRVLWKRSYRGTSHHPGAKHRNRCVAEFSGRHDVREIDTIEWMGSVVSGMVGKRLMRRDLIA